MTKFRSRWSSRRIVFRSAAVLTIPLFLLLLLFLANTVNPMANAFLTTFEVVNQTQRTLTITPIGAVGDQGDRTTLPMTVSGKFSWPASKASKFRILPNSSQTLHYDWDDVQFCEILVEDEDGGARILKTGLHPIEGQYRRPTEDRFIIRSFELLPHAEKRHEVFKEGRFRRMLGLYALLGSGLLCPIFFYLSRSPNNSIGKTP